ncbi:MAG TPA: glycosyltransferase family 39 protein [bacterium]|nr:glycosyltransferase family 39 protein [bacterium]
MLRLFSCCYGLNPFTWYLSSCLIAITTAITFYFFAKNHACSKKEALLFVCLTLLGSQASTYARFGTPETTAICFTALAFLCASTSTSHKTKQIICNILFVIFAALAALNKEACILMLPAFAAYKVWITAKRNNFSFKQGLLISLPVVVALLILFGGCMEYIKVMKLSGPGYAQTTFVWPHFRNQLKILMENNFFTVLLNIWFVWENRKKDQWLRFEFIGYYLVLALIVLPQVVLYSKIGLDQHYLFPAVIGVAFSTIYPLVSLKEKLPNYYKIAFIVIALVILQRCLVTYNHFKDVAKTTGEIRVFTEDLSRVAGSDRRVLICGNPQAHYEMLDAINTILGKLIKNNQTFLATYGSANDMVTTDIFKKDETDWAFLKSKDAQSWFGQNLLSNMNQKSRKDIQVIVLFSADSLNNVFLKTSHGWFNPKLFAYKDYPEPYNLRLYYKIKM